MNKTIRSTFCLTCLAVWTLFLGILCLPLLLLPASKSSLFFKIWGQGALWLMKHLCGITYKIEDPEGILNNTTQPRIYAVRHESAWETIALFALIPEGRPILKKSLLKIPVYGWYARRMKMIPIDRSGNSKTLKYMITKAQETVDAGLSVIIYPHGTRVNPGEIGKIHMAGLYGLSKALELPIVPIWLDSGKCWPKKSMQLYAGTIILKVQKKIEYTAEKNILKDIIYKNL